MLLKIPSVESVYMQEVKSLTLNSLIVYLWF